MGLGITLTTNEIKEIKMLIRPLELTVILLKGTTKKLLVKKKDYSVMFLEF